LIKKTIAVAVAALLTSGVALAQTAQQGQTAQTPAPAADEPTSPWAYNIGVVSDYRFRGISQTQRDPAVQGGIDYTHDSGFYLGFWASSIRFIRSSGGDGRAELDFYGGYRGKVWEDKIAYDLGVLRYQYPKANLAVSPNTTEIYGAFTYGPATLKYSHSVGDKTFGVPDSQGSGYLELAATFDTGFWGISVTPHIGHQRFRHNGIASYTDYSIGLTKEVYKGLTASITAVDTNADEGFYTLNGKFNGKAGVVAGLKYAF
jgi:uncharacterized protein (TIGR02001 family)